MNYENIDCIDCGTEFCPCHLAEAGECILCSQLQGKCFCDCKNWKGVCIYQEFANNDFKAKPGRKIYEVNIKEKVVLDENLLKLVIESPHKLVMDLIAPGSFIFIRGNVDNEYFDFPISIEEANSNDNTLTLFIEIRGIKTKKILKLGIGDILTIRGPYFNGSFGIRNINNTEDSKVLVLARGIGIAPAMPVINKLITLNNSIKVINDIKPFKEDYLKDKLDSLNINTKHLSIIDKGELTDDIKNLIKKEIDSGVELIHCSGADILIYRLLEFLESINKVDIKLSCSNNSKMCCGEGVCGSCSARFSSHNIKRLCKVQSDPKNIFEGRRFI